MGRKSLKDIRSKEIIEAFWRVVEEKGLDATSLEDIASEAGMQRRTIRHYMGNRDDLVTAAIAAVFDKQMENQAELNPELNPQERFRTIIRWLFSEAYLENQVNRMTQGIVSAANHVPAVSSGLTTLYEGLVDNLDREMKLAWPDMKKKKRERLAYIIVSLSFGNRHMRSFGFERKDSKAARDMVLDMLPQD